MLSVLFLGLVGAAAMLFAAKVAQRARERRLFASSVYEPAALEGFYEQASTVVSLERFGAVPPPKLQAGQPYRRELDHGELGSAHDDRHARARSALRSARWLLMEAVTEANAAASCHSIVQADRHTMVQNRSECEALRCIFEAEDRLGTRIVRDAGEPRCFNRFYGQAETLLATVTDYYAKAFEPREESRASGAEPLRDGSPLEDDGAIAAKTDDSRLFGSDSCMTGG